MSIEGYKGKVIYNKIDGYKEKVIYNKLVRDRIPEVILAEGAESATRELSQDEFISVAHQKLVEEAQEVVEAKTREELIKEYADLREVLDAVMRVQGITEEEVQRVQDAKRESRGGFERRLLLEWSTNVGYKNRKEDK